MISGEGSYPNDEWRGGGGRLHILPVLISGVRPSGLVDVHPVFVLPSRTALVRVLLLSQTLRDFLERRVESFFMIVGLAGFGGAVFRERDELRVQSLEERRRCRGPSKGIIV